MSRVVVDIGQQYGLGERGSDVLSRASVAVSARSNLKHSVLLERNGRQTYVSLTL